MKKRTIIFLFLIIACLNSIGQDYLYKSNGEKVAVKITEKTPEYVKYKLFGSRDVNEYRISTDLIFMIDYEDGTIENFRHDIKKTEVVADDNQVEERVPVQRQTAVQQPTNQEPNYTYDSSQYDFSGNEDSTLESAKKVKSNRLISRSYDRSSLNIVALRFNDESSKRFTSPINELEIPAKFYENFVNTETITINASRSEFIDGKKEDKPISTGFVTQWVNDEQVGKEIISDWFDRGDDGSFSLSTLKDRGVYNATDDDYYIASASKRGAGALEDLGLDIVNNSYTLLFDFYDLEKYSYYDKALRRTVTGYNVKVTAYLYKLNFSEEVAASFFENMWISENNLSEQKKRNFEGAKFKMNFVEKYDITATAGGTDYSTFVALANVSLEEAILNMEKNHSDFRVKELVSQVNPIGVKIGQKEGLKFDQRYFVFENRQKRNGEVYSKRRGVIKAMKVVNNKGNSTGDTDPSLFYQIAGKSIDAHGMFVEQRNSKNTNLLVGYNAIGFTGVTTKFEVYSGQFAYSYSDAELNKFLRSTKSYLKLVIGSDEYDRYDYTFVALSFGMGKDIHPTRNLFVSPYIGYGWEMADPNNDLPSWWFNELSITTGFAQAGVDIGYNLLHNVQLFATGEFNLMVYSRITENQEDSYSPFTYYADLGALGRGDTYSEVFPERGGLTAGAGIRIMF